MGSSPETEPEVKPLIYSPKAGSTAIFSLLEEQETNKNVKASQSGNEKFGLDISGLIYTKSIFLQRTQ